MPNFVNPLAHLYHPFHSDSILFQEKSTNSVGLSSCLQLFLTYLMEWMKISELRG